MITSETFGLTKDGTQVTRYWLSDGKCRVAVLTYGGIIQTIEVPDREGNLVDVILGFDSPAGYEAQTCYIGAMIGRCANRIGRGMFSLNGKDYTLACNDNGVHHLHGGMVGFDQKHWQAEVQGEMLVLRLHSNDGEEGYPGNLDVQICYTLKDGALSIQYDADTDADTLCNLTNHSYFNLAGKGDVGAQKLCIYASEYAPLGEEGIPDGTRASVAGTPMDLRTLTPIGAHWDDDFEQLRKAGGYDHHYCVDGTGLRLFAQAVCEENGIHLSVQSDMPGMQLYTANFLEGMGGKARIDYGRRQAFCLETQFVPNPSAWEQEFQPVLRKGEHYQHKTIFAFCAE